MLRLIFFYDKRNARQSWRIFYGAGFEIIILLCKFTLQQLENVERFLQYLKANETVNGKNANNCNQEPGG